MASRIPVAALPTTSSPAHFGPAFRIFSPTDLEQILFSSSFKQDLSQAPVLEEETATETGLFRSGKFQRSIMLTLIVPALDTSVFCCFFFFFQNSILKVNSLHQHYQTTLAFRGMSTANKRQLSVDSSWCGPKTLEMNTSEFTPTLLAPHLPH